MFINPDWTHIYSANEDLKVHIKVFRRKETADDDITTNILKTQCFMHL